MLKNKKIIVGVSEIPPLVIKGHTGYTGFDIELWEKIAVRLKLDFYYKNYPLNNLLPATHNAHVDIAIAGLTRTEDRENVINFSHYTLNSGLVILINKNNKLNLRKFIKELFIEK